MHYVLSCCLLSHLSAVVVVQWYTQSRKQCWQQQVAVCLADIKL